MRVHHCQVVGIDLTQELCDVAADRTRRVGLSDRVEIRQGDALILPFPDDSFDVAWTNLKRNVEESRLTLVRCVADAI